MRGKKEGNAKRSVSAGEERRLNAHKEMVIREAAREVITVTERMGKKGEATEVEPIVVEETMAQEVAAEDTEEITIMAADPVVMVAATFNM